MCIFFLYQLIMMFNFHSMAGQFNLSRFLEDFQDPEFLKFLETYKAVEPFRDEDTVSNM